MAWDENNPITSVTDWLSKPVDTGSMSAAGLNKVGLLGAILKDAGGMGNGSATTNFLARAKSVTDLQKRTALNQKIKAAYSSGDMNQVRQALLDADAAGEDLSHITGALTFGQPKVQDIGGAGYSIDPLTGAATKVIEAKPQKPLIAGGLQSLDNGKTWSAIPGFVQQQGALATIKRKPAAAKPSAGFAAPWTLFGGQ